MGKKALSEQKTSKEVTSSTEYKRRLPSFFYRGEGVSSNLLLTLFSGIIFSMLENVAAQVCVGFDGNKSGLIDPKGNHDIEKAFRDRIGQGGVNSALCDVVRNSTGLASTALTKCAYILWSNLFENTAAETTGGSGLPKSYTDAVCSDLKNDKSMLLVICCIGLAVMFGALTYCCRHSGGSHDGYSPA